MNQLDLWHEIEIDIKNDKFLVWRDKKRPAKSDFKILKSAISQEQLRKLALSFAC